MPPKVGIARVYAECNSFVARPTTWDDYEQTRLLTDGALLDVRGNQSEVAGFVEGLDGTGLSAVPLLDAWVWPGGVLTSECFDRLRSLLVSRVREEGDLRGVLIALHGSMVADGVDRADETLLRALREELPDATIVATFDLHANLTDRMADLADGLVVYHTYPHTDLRETGHRAAGILASALATDRRPFTAVGHIPMVPDQLGTVTHEQPMAGLLERAQVLASAPGVLDVSIAAGFAYADVPELGMSVVVVADESSVAEAGARSLAGEVWSRRDDFARPIAEVGVGIRSALEEPRGPVLIADVGDNVGGGTPGDGTAILTELLEVDQRLAGGLPPTLVILADPESVIRCEDSGVGSTVVLDVGGKTDPLYPNPVRISGTVRLIADGRFVNRGQMREGIEDDQGKTAVVQHGALTLVLTSRKLPSWNRRQFESLGIHLADMHMIVVKATLAFRAAYELIATRIIPVNSPGATIARFTDLPFSRRPSPLYPFDRTEIPTTSERNDER